jgi:hypothetical protein
MRIEEALRIDDVAALNALCSYIKKQALVDHSISPRQGQALSKVYVLIFCALT